MKFSRQEHDKLYFRRKLYNLVYYFGDQFIHHPQPQSEAPYAVLAKNGAIRLS